jgi:hypothetical protein
VNLRFCDPVVLEKRILKIFFLYKHMSKLFSMCGPIRPPGTMIWTWICTISQSLSIFWLNGSWVQYFSMTPPYFCNYLPFKENLALYLNNKFPIPKNVLYQVWLKLARWFWRLIDWLIDYLGFYVPLKNISLIWRRHHCRWRAAKILEKSFLAHLSWKLKWAFLIARCLSVCLSVRL